LPPERERLSATVEEEIRAIVRKHAKLSLPVEEIGLEDDLYLAGMTSHASVNVMLALDGQFDVEFPDRMLRRGVFESIAAIQAALLELRANR
jgi:acyl carrier protein